MKFAAVVKDGFGARYVQFELGCFGLLVRFVAYGGDANERRELDR